MLGAAPVAQQLAVLHANVVPEPAHTADAHSDAHAAVTAVQLNPLVDVSQLAQSPLHAAGTGSHVPVAQVLHVPEHARSQHMPSMHAPLAQSMFWVHASLVEPRPHPDGQLSNPSRPQPTAHNAHPINGSTSRVAEIARTPHRTSGTWRCDRVRMECV
jgi:hypothetical protein